MVDESTLMRVREYLHKKSLNEGRFQTKTSLIEGKQNFSTELHFNCLKVKENEVLEELKTT